VTAWSLDAAHEKPTPTIAQLENVLRRHWDEDLFTYKTVRFKRHVKQPTYRNQLLERWASGDANHGAWSGQPPSSSANSTSSRMLCVFDDSIAEEKKQMLLQSSEMSRRSQTLAPTGGRSLSAMLEAAPAAEESTNDQQDTTEDIDLNSLLRTSDSVALGNGSTEKGPTLSKLTISEIAPSKKRIDALLRYVDDMIT